MSHAVFVYILVFLSASKEGLSRAELEDILSLDDETLQNIYLSHLPPDPDNIRIPSSLMSQLIKDTKEYMLPLKSGGKNVIKWYHRQFEEVSHIRLYALKITNSHAN